MNGATGFWLGPWCAWRAALSGGNRAAESQRACVFCWSTVPSTVVRCPALMSCACLVLMIWAQDQSGPTRFQWLGRKASSLWVCLVAMIYGVRALAPAPHPEADYLLPLRALGDVTKINFTGACLPAPSFPLRTRPHHTPTASVR